jgi:hypothetical protein
MQFNGHTEFRHSQIAIESGLTITTGGKSLTFQHLYNSNCLMISHGFMQRANHGVSVPSSIFLTDVRPELGEVVDTGRGTRVF